MVLELAVEQVAEQVFGQVEVVQQEYRDLLVLAEQAVLEPHPQAEVEPESVEELLVYKLFEAEVVVFVFDQAEVLVVLMVRTGNDLQIILVLYVS